MAPKRGFISKLKNGLEKLRGEGLPRTTLYYCLRVLYKIGIVVIPFYYMKESCPRDIPASLTALPDGLVFSTFGREDVREICRLSEREGFVGEQYMLGNFDTGAVCLGVKSNGRIAAFGWFSTDKVRGTIYPVEMKANEAYLFDMFVLSDFRGKNLAPILRYKTYETLKSMGRDTFYSITETGNDAAIRFKQKLNAQIVFMAVDVEFFKKRQAMWVLKRY